ncbi:hypothetical protein C4J93_1154 [Pseudomonas sp. R2-37-08W]|nr:hypothetical protein C4J93_1154 [Pseudomonas sp. R2-37-08W]AZF14676.1 hypothetical protein C4J92_1176 [Pseudomonas sp. R3-18-08]
MELKLMRFFQPFVYGAVSYKGHFLKGMCAAFTAYTRG